MLAWPAMRRLAALVVFAAVSLPASLAAALPDDPAKMQHRVDIGFTPLYLAQLDGRHQALTDGPIDELNVGSVGVLVGYAFRPWRLLEFRIRGQWLKPFPGRGALNDGLHELRATLGLAAVLPLGSPHLELAFASDLGPGMFRLRTFEDPSDGPASNAAAFTVAWTAAFRGWITDHTGFWAEAGFGLNDASGAGQASGIASRWPLQVTLGYADRF
jgi:hypothetical protein